MFRGTFTALVTPFQKGAIDFAALEKLIESQIAVGITGICFVLYSFIVRVPGEPQQPSAAAGAFWGSLAGFTSTIIQVGAPP